MTDLTLRNVKGSPLTNQEVDDNFSGLNTDKYEAGDSPTFADVTADSVQLTGGTGSQGSVTWNADEETLDIIQNGATLQVGQEIQIHCRNNTGSTIGDGVAVYATGTIGNSGRITVAPMIANGTIAAKYFLGITTEEILNGEDGKVTTFGKVRGLDTTAFTDGDVLYVSPTTAGALTATMPAAPNLSLPIAFVIHAHSNGTIFCRATARDENESLKAANNLSDLTNAATARTNLGLGTAATTDSTAYATAAQGTLADAALPASSYTAADVLTKVKTVDGAGSGLDADLLDGNHASAFATSAQGSLADSAIQPSDNISDLTNDSGYITGNQTITLSGDVSGSGTTSISVTVADDSHNHIIANVDGLQSALDGKVDDSQVLTNVPSGAVFTDTTYSVGNGGLTEINFTSALNSKLAGIEAGATADQTASEILTAVKTVDGSGSGLDADLLDGIQGGSFLRSDADDTAFGAITFNNNVYLADQMRIGDDAWIEDFNYANSIRIKGNQNSNAGYIAFGNRTELLGQDNDAILRFGGNKVWHEGNDGSGSGLDADLLDGQQGSAYMRSNVSATNSVDLRAPIFYDSNNTGYYTDPNSSSRFNDFYPNRISCRNNGDLGTPRWDFRAYVVESQHWYGPSFSTTMYLGESGNPVRLRGSLRVGGDANADSGMSLTAEGNANATSSLRAPIFYDSNNTGYYVDPNGTSNLNGLSIGGFAQTQPSMGYWMTTSTFFYDTTSHYYFIKVATMPSNGKLSIEYHVQSDVNYPQSARGSIQVSSWAGQSISGKIENFGSQGIDTQLWLDNSNNVWIKSYAIWDHSFRWRVMENVGCTVYQSGWDKQEATPTGSYNLAIKGRGYRFSAGSVSAGPSNLYNFANYTDVLIAETNVASPIYYDRDNTGYYVDPNTTGTSVNVAGSIIAGGNVTAYSDRKVKDNIEPITNALDKVQQLNGVTFNRIDLSDKTKRYAGLIAQDIEKVLPEAVDDDVIKRVDYNATIGLLVEAIKELTAKVETLESKLAQKEH